MKQSSEPKIVVKGLEKSFGFLQVLKGIDAEIDKGEVICVIGPSGSGKSTFLRCLNRLEESTAGEILVDGEQITGKNADIDRIRGDLMTCLAEVIGYYTKGESSSVKAETARKLSLSMLYNIDTYLLSLGDNGAALRALGERRIYQTKRDRKRSHHAPHFLSDGKKRFREGYHIPEAFRKKRFRPAKDCPVYYPPDPGGGTGRKRILFYG